MALTPGTRLGPYEVTALLGAGGMGEVYRARDTRLDRPVAIKVLPSHLAADPDARVRFEREARAVSALNHSHICALYDIGSIDGVAYLVLELLDGETLEQRLAKGPLPISEALRYAMEVADALDRAHHSGIVHRDLKPGNVFLARTGGHSGRTVAKLLDFGLAKAMPVFAGVGPSQAPTMKPITGEGAILGTVQYMAPEQLEGREADPRTDVFAFGALLYEMVTGRRAFEGKSQASLIAAILEHEPPPVSSLQPVSPPLLDHLVKTCLAKAMDDRWHSMHDVLLQLRVIASSGGSAGVAERSVASRTIWLPWAAAAALILAVIATAAYLTAARKVPEAAKVAFEIPVPVTAGSAFLSPTLTISPDGTQLVVVASTTKGVELRIRSLDKIEARVLARITDNVFGDVFPFWSPDSRFLAFFDEGKLLKVDVFGNPAQTICQADGFSGAGAWNRDGVILFAPSPAGPLFSVPDSGGKPVPVTELDATHQETAHRDPSFLPDGKHFIYLSLSSVPANSGIYVGALGSKERKRLLSSTLKALYASEHLLFLRGDGVLMAQRFDPARLELSSDPFRVADAVATDMTTTFSGAAGFTASEQRSIAFQPTGSGDTHLLWHDQGGKALGEVGTAARYANPTMAKNAQRLVVDMAGDLWIFDLLRGGNSRFTFNPAFLNGTAVWSPDGARLIFASARGGTPVGDLYVKNAHGAEPEQLLLENKNKNSSAIGPEDWSPDGRWLLFEKLRGLESGLWALSLVEKLEPQPVAVVAPSFAAQGRFSPDGRWVAYASNESGHAEVYVTRFPASGKWQLSTKGGGQPRWRQDGKELYFLSLSGEAMAVDVAPQSDGTFQAGTPRKLFQANPTTVFAGRNSWDVTPDGQRFLINSGGDRPPITVIVNWNK